MTGHRLEIIVSIGTLSQVVHRASVPGPGTSQIIVSIGTPNGVT